MRKIVVLGMLLVILAVPEKVDAALLTVSDTEGAVWNVLSYEDELRFDIPDRESLEFKNLASNPTPDPNAEVYLKRIDDRVQLSVVSGSGQVDQDVTDFSQDLVEIEEKDQPKKVVIINLDGGFGISQRGILAKTDYAINIDAGSRKLSVEAPSGLRYVAILPYDALLNLLRAKIIDRMDPEKQIVLSEGEKGEIGYLIPGHKVIDLFNLIDLPVAVVTTVSASTGEVLHVDQPVWLGILSFLFA